MSETLWSITSLPNLHPALVHFPVALLLAALGFDIACLFLRRQVWIDRAAAALYALGALGASAAYLAGRQAADSVGNVSPTAEVLMVEHSDWAFLTLLVFSGIGLLRIGLSWWEINQSVIRVTPLRLIILFAAIGGQWLLFGTAERGGALVYRYGVAVAFPKNQSTTFHPEGREGTPLGPPETRLVRVEDGSLWWTPLPSDLGALGTILKPVEGTPGGVVITASDSIADEDGLALEVSGRAILVLPGTFNDVRVETNLNLNRFSGTVGIAHHVRGREEAGVFEISRGGRLALVHIKDDTRKVMDEGEIEKIGGSVIFSISVIGSHLKGFRDETVVLHGHMTPSPPGNIGLLLDGSGVIRVISIRVTPLGHD